MPKRFIHVNRRLQCESEENALAHNYLMEIWLWLWLQSTLLMSPPWSFTAKSIHLLSIIGVDKVNCVHSRSTTVNEFCSGSIVFINRQRRSFTVNCTHLKSTALVHGSMGCNQCVACLSEAFIRLSGLAGLSGCQAGRNAFSRGRNLITVL